jgi:dTDP-4-dehydrorhamnose 3,5-epimerase
MPNTTEFKITTTEIPGLLLINISQIADDRGYFQEKYQKEKLVAAGFPSDFVPVQQNISFNKEAGVTRGFHAEPWDKFISVVAGKVFAAFVDLRPGVSFGNKVTIEVDEGVAVFVPRGIANSYQTLVANVYYSYLVNAHWSAEALYQAVNLADPDLNIAWPISLDKAIISEKDKQNPLLKDIK